MNDAMRQNAVLGWNLAFSAGACAAGWAAVSPRFAASLALGAALEVVNFRALFSFSERALLRGNAAGAAVGAFGLRFVLLGAVLWVALAAGAHVLGLLVGLSLIIPAVLLAAWRARPQVVEGFAGPLPDDPSWEEWNPWLARERAAGDDEEETS
jgi:hypothetical protein